MALSHDTRWPWRRAIVVLAGFLLWIGLLEFPSHVAGDDLDASWQQCLGHFLVHRLQAGVDWIFTYGPLGYFATTAYVPELFWAKCLWEVLIKLLAAAVLCFVAARLPCRFARWLFLGAALAVLPEDPRDTLSHRGDALFGVAVLGLGLLPHLYPRRALAVALTAAAVLAVLALVKFTLFLLALAAVVLLTLTLAGRGHWRTLWLPPALFAGGVVLAWGLAGQDLANFPAYLRSSYEIADGYTAAMSSDGPSGHVVLALAIIGTLLGALLTQWRTIRQAPRLLGASCFLAGLTFVHWKLGFVRHDIHAVVFFNFALVASLVALGVFPTPDCARPFRGLILCAAGLSLAGHLAVVGPGDSPMAFLRARVTGFGRNLTHLVLPHRLHEELEARRRQAVAKVALPRIREVVGDAPLDLFTVSQGVALANGLHYRPRPVFQSYTAYTPYLLERNAAFYRSERAPDYVLAQWLVIDDRFPAADDGPALREVLQRYRPVVAENGWLLLKRDGDGSLAARPEAATTRRTLRFDEEVRLDKLPGEGQVLELDMAYSRWGAVRKFLHKPPPLFLRVTRESGEEHAYRLIPELARAGFLLNPPVETTNELVGLTTGQAGRRVRTFRVTTDGPASYGVLIQATLRPAWPPAGAAP